MISMTLIVPAAHAAVANSLAVSLGHAPTGDATYNVRLSEGGAGPATHYGCRTWVTPGFALMIQIATSGVVPDGTDAGLAAMALGVRTQHPDVMAALIHDALETDDPFAHWTAVLAAHGLQRIAPAGMP